VFCDCDRVLKERDHLGDINIDGMIILKWAIKKKGVRVWNGFTWHRVVTSGGIL
jgi:hypothetical protein